MSFRFIDLFAGIGGMRLAGEAAGGRCVFSSEINPAARRTYSANFGAAPDGDITRIASEDIPEHDVLLAGFPCFPSGTLIETASGFKPIEDIAVGDVVLTHRRRLRPVAAIMSRADAPLLSVRMTGVPPIRTTGEHPFYVRRRTRIHRRDGARKWVEHVFSGPEWVAAKDLDGDCFAALPIGTPSGDWAHRPDPAVWRLVGRWLGSGWIVDCPGSDPCRHDGRIGKTVICTGRDDADFLAGVIGDAGYDATRVDERTVSKFIISSHELVGLLEPFGHGASGKQMAPFVFGAPIEIQQAIWDGWIDAVGHRAASGRVRGRTVSRALALGLSRLAMNISGRLATVQRVDVQPTRLIDGRHVRRQPFYIVTLRDKVVGRTFTEGGFTWVRVKEVLATERSETVFNFEVHEDNSYVAEGLVVHNCQTFSKAGGRRGFEDARGTLFFDVARIARDRNTRLLLLENVKGLVQHDGGRTLDVILGTLRGLGYSVSWSLLNSNRFGLAQSRERLIIVARHGNAFEFPDARSLPMTATLADVLEAEGDFEFLDPGGYTLVPDGMMRTQATGLVFCGYRNKPVRVSGVRAGTEHLSRAHKQQNRIYCSSGTHPTLSSQETSGRHFVRHAGRVRKLTVKECYRLQGFPDDFVRVGSYGDQQRQIGNSVPVPMIAEILGAAAAFMELPLARAA